MSAIRTAAWAGLLGVAMTALVPSPAAAGGKGWTHDMAAAMKQAKEEKKDLLLDFTGSDWCGWCIRLNEEVFSQEAFKAEGPKHFVLVELDFPNDKSNLSEETQKQNEEWSQKLSVRGFPTIFLTDADGRPYAQTGYQDGGADKYVAHLAELREVREKRDVALAAAEKAKGVKRAEHLDEAMTAVGEELALGVYGDQVREIIKLDKDNAAGLKEKYEQKLAGVEYDKAVQAIQQSFDGTNAEETLKNLDEATTKYSPDAARQLSTNMFRVHVLRAAERNDEVFALLDTLMADASLEPLQKIQLGLQRVGILQQLDKNDEAVKVFDQLIEMASTEGNVKAQVIYLKANALAQAGKVEEASKVYDEAAASTDDDGLKARIEQAKAELTAASAETSGQ